MVKFDVADRTKYKVPHMGWNRVNVKKASPLMRGIEPEAEFYFVHAYHVKMADDREVMSETRYSKLFPSAIERDNIFGVQYHPEKSHDAGEQILKNFVAL